MKVNQWTLGIAAAGIIAFATICSSAKSDPPAQVAIGESSQQAVIVANTDTSAKNTSPTEVVVVSQTDIRRVIAKSDQGITIGKEVVVFGPKLAAGVITVVADTHHTAAVAHPYPRVLAIPVVMVV